MYCVTLWSQTHFEECSDFYIWISGCKWSLSEPRWCHYWQWVLATWVMSSYLTALHTPPVIGEDCQAWDVDCPVIGELEIINTCMMILISSNLQTHQYFLSAKDIFKFEKKYKKKELFACYRFCSNLKSLWKVGTLTHEFRNI